MAGSEFSSRERWLSATSESSPVALIGQDRAGSVVSWNRAATVLLGFPAERVIGRPAELLVPGTLKDPLQRLERQALEGDVIRDHETRLRTSAGGELAVSLTLAPLRADDESVVGIVTAASGISHQQLLESRLRRLADRDALTGLYGRRRFDEELRRAIARSSRHGEELALVVIDIDGLKACNDSRGHQAGDRLLCAAASALARRTRASDVLARIGGDEFALILPRTGGGQAEQLANQLLISLRACNSAEIGAPVRVTASAGVAALERHASSDEFLHVADAGMYRAKRAGGDRVARLEPDGPPDRPRKPRGSGGRLELMPGSTPVEALLERLEEFDNSGGASVGLLAWEMCVEEEQVEEAWDVLIRTGLIEPAGFDQDELLYRLTPAGWTAREGRTTAERRHR